MCIRDRAQFVEHGQGQPGRFQHAAPRQRRVRVEIEHEMIRRFDAVAGSAPTVELDAAHLRGTDQSRHAVDFHQPRVAGVQLGIEVLDIGDRQALGMLLEEDVYKRQCGG